MNVNCVACLAQMKAIFFLESRNAHAQSREKTNEKTRNARRRFFFLILKKPFSSKISRTPSSARTQRDKNRQQEQKQSVSQRKQTFLKNKKQCDSIKKLR